jgi:BlaI family transcriptional regulator, penicillinase repressor
MFMAKGLTDREADVMKVLWEHGASTVAEVRERLKDALAYTTVLTILRTMHTKGLVDYKQEGRAYRYSAKVQQQAARKSAVKHLMGKLFQGSADLLITQLVAEHKLDDDQVARIQKILEENKSKRK